MPRMPNSKPAVRVLVGAGSTVILPAVAYRYQTWIVNIGAETVYLQTRLPATVGSGFPLTVGAAKLANSFDALYGISVGGGGQVAVWEDEGVYVGPGGGGGGGSESGLTAPDHYSASRGDFTVALKPASTDTLVLTFPAGFFAVSDINIETVAVRLASGLEVLYDPETTPFVWDPVLGELTVVGAVFGPTDIAYDVDLVGPPRSVSSGGAAGGGDSLYISPADFNAAWVGPATDEIVLTGLPFVPSIEQFVAVTVVLSTGLTRTYSPASNAFAWNTVTGVLTITGAAVGATDLAYRVMLFGPDKTYVPATDSKNITEIDPLDQHVTSEELEDATNLAAGTYYYPSASGVNMQGHKEAAVEFLLTGDPVLTVWATIDDDAVPDWIDITRSGVDISMAIGGIAAYTGCSGIVAFENLNVLRLRCQVVSAVGAPNTVQLHIRQKAL